MNKEIIVPVWKPQGWTPLAAIHALKKQHPKYQKATISYAGRLDPMAEGVLLLLVNDANKNRHLYERFAKTYEAEMVLGITTDSLDALGIITHDDARQVYKETIVEMLAQFVGVQNQAYPIYSSRTVRGKPLYWWARNNRIAEITIPHKTIEVSTLQFLKQDAISVASLHSLVHKKIKQVTGNFRQQEILSAWDHFAETHIKQTVTRVKIRLSCSSGTYVRQLISDIGESLGCGGFALSITRTRVEVYTKRQCIHIR